jgi:hypothetical protein
MKIYIAGPMTGYEKWNFPAFFEAERVLKNLGHEPINPAHNDGTNLEDALKMADSRAHHPESWANYMRVDLVHVLECDALCLLPGWQKSRGASLEYHVATQLGLPIYVIRDEQLIPRIKLIGISGYARSGKDTIANHLVEKYGYHKVSFANPMKVAMEKLNPTIRIVTTGQSLELKDAVDFYGWEELKKLSPDIRPLLQRFGTEVGREMFGENFWVEQALDSIPDGATAVIADVRFPNEAGAIRDLGGKVIRVERTGTAPANAHASETALDTYSFDDVLSNDGDVEDILLKIDEWMKDESRN